MRIAVTNADRELVMGVVCDQYTVTRHELVSRCRVYDLAEARHVAMTILRGRGYSFQSIADTFNRANHGTVIAAVKRVADQASIDRRGFYGGVPQQNDRRRSADAGRAQGPPERRGED